MRVSTLLIVDDNEGPRIALEGLLEPVGYRLLFAADGPTALDLAEREQPDLMLLDVMMPGMDGFEVCRRLRASPAIAEMPVVMVTALDDEASRLKGLRAGADDFLTKPVKRPELLARVGTITRLNRYRRLLEQRERIDFMAHHDPATRLPNRAGLVAALEREMEAGAPFALLILGLPGLEEVTESLGQGVAEQALAQLVERLRAGFSAAHTLARVDGRQLALLLPGVTDPRGVDAAASRIRRWLGQPLEVGGRALFLDCALGVALYPQDASEADALLTGALAALRQASEGGRCGYAFHNPALAGAVRERLELRTELRRALEAGMPVEVGESGGLHLVYQPQVDVVADAMTGVEGLARWAHPQRGPISPGAFVPVAEDSGLIVDLGRRVVEAACRQIRAWDAAGLPPFSVGVNVSALEVRRADYVDELMRIVAGHGVSPARLELELTESALVPAEGEGGEAVMDLLARLKSLGFRLALDDFGTGYSSLQYLKRYPIDKLKIDRSFVIGLPEDGGDVAIVRAIVAMCRSLGMAVIAEGVETPRQAAFLRSEGCRLIQGFLYSRPLGSRELVDYAQGRPRAEGGA
jgi:diguanylate cyclase (GGDEF)-like protein